MKKIILIIIILLSSGCTDYVEVNDLAIVPGMIIDYIDGEYELTAELILNNNETTIKKITTKCKTINKCISNVSTTANKRILMSQLKVLLITKNVILNDIDYYEYFLRSSNSKMNFNIFIIKEEDKEKIFNIKTNNYGVSLYIEKLSSINNDTISSSLSLPLIELVYKKLENIDILYPSIYINEEDIYLKDLIFYKDNKEYILNEKESISYNILNNNINKSVLDIKCDKGLFSITLEKVKTKKKFKNNILNFNINISSDINDYNCEYDLNKKDSINKLEDLAKKEIKNNLNDIISISKNNNYDYLAIRNYLYKHNNKYYKNNNKLNNVKTNINIDLSINSIGETRW